VIVLESANIATADAARWLASLGVDAIKVGVGPGRGCRTRLETGTGVPPLQAVREAWLGAEGKVPIIADGGVQNDKDIFLEIACGASAVMLGSLLAGTVESPGMVVEDPATRQKVKLYRGMTSPEAVADAAEDAEASVRRPRGSPSACPTWAAWSGSSPASAATSNRRSAMPERRICAPHT